MLSNSDIRKVQDNRYVVTTFNLQTVHFAQVSIRQGNTQNKVKQTERHHHIGGITSALRISLKAQTLACVDSTPKCNSQGPRALSVDGLRDQVER